MNETEWSYLWISKKRCHPAFRLRCRIITNSNSIFSLDFYQKEAVSGKIVSAAYEIYMADGSGKPVSDKKTVIADKTGTNGAERVFRTRFTLKSMEFIN